MNLLRSFRRDFKTNLYISSSNSYEGYEQVFEKVSMITKTQSAEASFSHFPKMNCIKNLILIMLQSYTVGLGYKQG